MIHTSTSRSKSSRWAAAVFTMLVTIVLAFTTYAGAADLKDSLTNDTGSIALDRHTPAVTPPPTAASSGMVNSRPRPTATKAETPDVAPEMAASTVEAVDDSGVSVADGYIVDGETLSPFDTDHPAIMNLDEDLRLAVQEAASDAEADGIEMVINSGWRSEHYQQVLLDEAIVTYGSEEEASKWVKSPDDSSHVTGDAVDVGYTDADYWLIQYGNQYGLCQTYANEIWHFELMVEPGETCPAPIDDASAG